MQWQGIPESMSSGQEGESEEVEDLILPLLPLPNFLSVPNSVQAFQYVNYFSSLYIGTVISITFIFWHDLKTTDMITL